MTSVFSNPGSPGASGGASGGKVYAFNNISESGLVVVAPINPSRQSITFYNPGLSDIFIAPAFVQNSGSDVALTPSNAALGGCVRIYANGGQYTISGECQKAWQAFSITGSGTTNSLTVYETNA